MRLLIVEDKDSFRRLLVQALAHTEWAVQAVGDPNDALALLDQENFDAVATDLRLPGFSGLELLKRAKRLHPEIRVIVMSAFGEARDIVEAMQNGADDFLPKPFDLDLFQNVLNRIQSLTLAPPPNPREPWIVRSSALHELDQELQKAALTHLPALFIGENGVGKRRCARRLHVLRHPHAPFLTIDAASLSPGGLEPHLLQRLQGGSLHLCDLDTTSFKGLPTLINAMDSDLGQDICWSGSAQKLEEVPPPLRDRLGVISFVVPPLRERKEDTLPLFRMLVEVQCKSEGRTVPLVEKIAERELLQRNWPGNVHELAWCATQVLNQLDGAIIGGPLPQPVNKPAHSLLALSWPSPGTLENMLHQVQKEAEAQLLKRCLLENDRDAAQTARILGLSTRSLAQRLREHGIPLDESP